MLIKDFLYDNPYRTEVKIITAPTKFGKSTVIDMVKRFVGITVNSNGTQITPSMTDNYKLFCDNKLNICKDQTVVTNHLGQYPVIHINYHPLKTVKDFNTLLEQLQLVVLDTFKEHTYLSQNSTLFFVASHKDFFIKHYSSTGVKTLTKNDIQRSFGWLSQLLFKHFGKKVIVLLDEYDAYFNKLLFDKIHDIENIITFLEGISKTFFKINDYVEKALLTGVLLIKGMGVLPTGERVRNYRFLGDHKFSHYYGFTQEEVLELLQKNIQDERIRRETEEVLKHYYDGYQIQNQHTRIYSMWSVLNFIESNMKLTSYWSKDNSIKGVANLIFKNKKMKREIKRLIFEEGHVSGDISEPLNREDIMNLKQIKIVQDMKLEHLAVLLFDFGYLTIIHGFLQTKFLTPLKIPNTEIYMELCKLLTNNYVVKYSCKVCYIETLFNAVYSFRFNQSNVKVYESFYQTTNDLITNSKYYPRSENDIQSFIFIILAAEFPIQKISTTKLCTNYVYNDSTVNNIPMSLKQRAMDILEKITTANKTNKDGRRMDIIVGNTHKMVIVIGIKFQKTKPKEIKSPLNDLAKDVLIQLLLKTYDPYLNQKPIVKFNKSRIYAKGRIYIGIAYDKDSRNISMAFYYPSFDKEPIFINLYDVNSRH